MPLHEGFGVGPAMFEYTSWNPYATPEIAAKAVADAITSYTDPRFYGWGSSARGGWSAPKARRATPKWR